MEKAFKYLQQGKEIALATSENGNPRLRVFQVMRQKGHTLWFATAPGKAVYQQLMTNPNIEALSMNGNISVRVRGKARFDVSDDIAQEIYNSNPVLPRLYKSYKDLVYFSLKTDLVDFFDLTTTPPTHISTTYDNV